MLALPGTIRTGTSEDIYHQPLLGMHAQERIGSVKTVRTTIGQAGDGPTHQLWSAHRVSCG